MTFSKRFGAIAETVAVDCSLLAHAFLPTQRTAEALAALDEIDRAGHSMIAAAVLFSEFPSLLRKSVTTGKLTRAEGQQLFDLFRRLGVHSVNVSPDLLQESWSVAISLNQGDTHDSMGYVVARKHGATFWTSDERFHNAARGRKLVGIRFVR